MKDGKSHWFIGSADCTDPARERNIEFFVKLVSKGKELFKPNEIEKQLTGTVEGTPRIRLFEPYDIDEERENGALENLNLEIRKL